MFQNGVIGSHPIGFKLLTDPGAWKKFQLVRPNVLLGLMSAC